MTDHELDLPLSANIRDVDISHFILHLTCDLDQQVLFGDITLFCQNVRSIEGKHNKQDNHHVTEDPCERESNKINKSYSCVAKDNLCDVEAAFKNPTDDSREESKRETKSKTLLCDEIVLDSHSLSVKSVEELILSPDMKSKLVSATPEDIQSETGIYMKCYSNAKSQNLDYTIGKHKITIKNHEKCFKNMKTFKDHTRTEDVAESNNMQTSHAFVNTVCCDSSDPKENHDDGILSQKENENSSTHEKSNITEGLRVVRISYSTKPEGPSLKWTADQDGRPCMFTVGHWLNNRAWFPSQDAPSAMPTWQAVVTVPEHLIVLMSGDSACQPHHQEGSVRFFYYSTMPMPSSTLAIAVGTWTQVEVTPVDENTTHRSEVPCTIHTPGCPVNYSTRPDLPCRVFTPACLSDVARSDLCLYMPQCLQEVHGILGNHPFRRLDVLVVPPCFDSLGMASPSLLFLSQSLLTGDRSMCARVAHEICHSWFGLLIGPRDWTEEWLTEGFCTYLEDLLHARVSQWSETETSERADLRALLKQTTLLSEVENTEEELQTLRPNQGEQLLSVSESNQYVKNGMNPDKAFMQVHYLKGFFLLKHLETMVGQKEFLDFLRQYVRHFHAQLVTSQDFFNFFFKIFPQLKCDEVNEEKLITDWLDSPGIHQNIKQFKPSTSNQLYNTVLNQSSSIMSFCKKTSVKRRKKQKIDASNLTFAMLNTDQLVVLLEMLLQADFIPGSVLDLLNNTYQLGGANSEIRHRWCELVVKHQHQPHYKDVENFLQNDQAMGVYLYGEMVLSGCKKQKQLAVQCFESVKQDMPEGARKTVSSMLYGT